MIIAKEHTQTARNKQCKGELDIKSMLSYIDSYKRTIKAYSLNHNSHTHTTCKHSSKHGKLTSQDLLLYTPTCYFIDRLVRTRMITELWRVLHSWWLYEIWALPPWHYCLVKLGHSPDITRLVTLYPDLLLYRPTRPD
ncbi:hypothetical protein VIGAN_10218000 [Vigna angularis var. angularis]|uniref:Uncharacterized protein n=1 Tax=Vigna angularis var. angularis TaxID=157739 RepID=A0A0S3T6S5_PHAAN|nr:hypothetical protein VIGAN_10218000 [Vigna angularis var. angularis]